MENVAILMFIFSGAILLYALLLAWTKDVSLIRRSYAAKMKDKKAYAVQFAKVLAVTSIAPFLTGIVGLITENVFFVGATFVVSLIICIRVGVKMIV